MIICGKHVRAKMLNQDHFNFISQSHFCVTVEDNYFEFAAAAKQSKRLPGYLLSYTLTHNIIVTR